MSEMEYGGKEWHQAMDSLLIEAGRLEGQYEENERRFREAIYGEAKPVESSQSAVKERV